MSTNPPEWSRLVAAARRAPQDSRDESAPYGFATRVAAQALGAKTPWMESSVLSRYGLRALGLSCLLAVAGVAATLRPVMTAIEQEASALNETPVEVETTELT
jgi:hypothetical protein